MKAKNNTSIYRTVIILLCVSSVLFFTISCKKNKTEPDKTYSNIIEAPKVSVIIVSKDTIKTSLISVDSTKIIFKDKSPGTNRLNVGEILISGVLDKAPVGFLRKIVSIKKEKGQIICETGQALLTEFIENGSFTKDTTYTTKEIFGKPDSLTYDQTPKLKTNGVVIDQSFSFNIGLDDGSTIQGKVSMDATVHLNYTIRHFSLQDINATVT